MLKFVRHIVGIKAIEAKCLGCGDTFIWLFLGDHKHGAKSRRHDSIHGGLKERAFTTSPSSQPNHLVPTCHHFTWPRAREAQCRWQRTMVRTEHVGSGSASCVERSLDNIADYHHCLLHVIAVVGVRCRDPQVDPHGGSMIHVDRSSPASATQCPHLSMCRNEILVLGASEHDQGV